MATLTERLLESIKAYYPNASLIQPTVSHSGQLETAKPIFATAVGFLYDNHHFFRWHTSIIPCCRKRIHAFRRFSFATVLSAYLERHFASNQVVIIAERIVVGVKVCVPIALTASLVWFVLNNPVL
ncbi:hypothetical protein [Alkalicoccobacillus porphyridii]|uniref:Uncharacterized protein n=1 Tax=Alkalicoccobacillus porphyridii TaxID=2597270 RepID=A0A554A2Z9_9BACI|nr:hypothetical protein [Alkalicoccobacillus porphyridii]TSB48071.1 hypothetical protein FN960_00505 [Alkalicoccobacillus porphyridii]